MLICHSWRLVFLHVPKCAGTVIRKMLHKHAPIGSATSLFDFEYCHILRRHVDLAHLPLMDMKHYSEWKFLKNYFSVASIRHPYARLLSACREYYRQKSRETEIQMRSAMPTDDQILRYLRYLPHALESHDLRYVHAFPIVWFTHYGNNPMVNELLRCESLADDILVFGEKQIVPSAVIDEMLLVARDNRDVNTIPADCALGGDIKALANILYAEDFNTFGYEREDAEFTDTELRNLINKSVFTIHSHDIECTSIAPIVRWYWGRNSNISFPYMAKIRD